MRSRAIIGGVALLGLAGLIGCGGSDVATAPQRQAPAASHSSLLLTSAKTVTALQRTAPLASSITVSKSIGILGGVISIPAAGVTVVVPALALTSTQTISVTALAGSKVAYEFQPHGITFGVPLSMTQDLTMTQAAPGGSINPASLFVGYFPNSSNVTSVTELLNVGLSVNNLMATAALWHFSGYIYAGGDSE